VREVPCRPGAQWPSAHLHLLAPLKLPGVQGGNWSVDGAFDGKTHTRANGTIYVISGEGGAPLHHLGAREMLFWQALARKYVPDQYSLTVVDVNGRTLTLRQIGAQGQELDRFVLTH